MKRFINLKQLNLQRCSYEQFNVSRSVEGQNMLSCKSYLLSGNNGFPVNFLHTISTHIHSREIFNDPFLLACFSKIRLKNERTVIQKNSEENELGTSL